MASTRATLTAALLAVAFLLGGIAHASAWTVILHTGSTGQAQTLSAPAAPTSVAAACVSSSQKSIKVTWGAVTHATSYLVYQSTTSATSGFSLMASGIATTSWTSASLFSGHYWYEVAVVVGVNWTSARSATTGSTTISSTSPNCQQP